MWRLDGFIRDYQEYYSEYAIKKVEETETATGKLAVILNEAKSKRYPLYLIIDEYDNFTNTVLNEQGEDVYWAITRTEGFYRDIFKEVQGQFRQDFHHGSKSCDWMT